MSYYLSHLFLDFGGTGHRIQGLSRLFLCSFANVTWLHNNQHTYKTHILMLL